mgnify:CR=1 FL=1
MQKAVEKCLGQIIVSCQAYEDTPLYGAENMKKMAQCALLGGAKAIRACWPQDIRAIRSLGDDFPIIGINKMFEPNKSPLDYIVITPTLASADEVIAAGLDILAVDCTLRPFRGREELTALLKSIKEKHPGLPIMADCGNVEEGVFAASTGYVDIVATTLAAYYETLDGPDVEFVRELRKRISLPINAEGSVWERGDVKKLVDAGADMICIGTAITRPHLITKRFIDYNAQLRKD